MRGRLRKLLRHRWFRRLVLLVFFCVALKFCAGLALGYALKKVFAAGTGCEVTLHNPQLSFFPIRGSIERVLIRNTQEAPGEGFGAERITVRFRPLQLLSRKLVLSDLRIEGAHAVSRISESGFLNTMAFLFPPPTENHGAAEDQDRWRFFVWDVAITPQRSGRTLELEFKDVLLAWSQLHLDAEIPEPDEDPAVMSVSSTEFDLALPGKAPVSFGKLEAKGTMGQGLLTLKEAIASRALQDGSGVSTISLTGKSRVRDNPKEKGYYDLNFDTDFAAAQLEELLGGTASWFLEAKPRLQLQGKLTGELIVPVVEGRAAVQFAGEPHFIKRPGCFMRRVSGGLRLDQNELQLDQVVADDFLTGENIRIRFSENQEVGGHFRLALDSERSIIQRCFASDREQTDSTDKVTEAGEEPHVIEEAIKGAIADSHTDIAIEGSLREPNLILDLSSEVSLRERSARSELQARLQYLPDLVKLNINEKGSFLQIQSAVPTATVSQATEAKQTVFTTARNSNLSAALIYHPESEQLEIEKLSLTRFPLERLLARAAPFLDDATFDRIRKFSDRQTLVNAESSLSYSFADKGATGDGNGELTDLILFEDRVPLTFKIRFDRSNISFPKFQLVLPAGPVSGSIALAEDGGLQGTLAGNALQLDQCTRLHRFLPGLKGTAELSAALSGTVSAPQYKAALSLTHFGNKGSQNPQSTISASGDISHVALEAALFDKHALISADYPFAAAKNDRVTLAVVADQFPLESIFAAAETERAESSPEEAPLSGVMTGELRYAGPRTDPLLGDGTLQIDQLQINAEGQQITQREALRASIEKGRLIFSDVRLRSGDRDIALTGYADRESGWRAKLSGQWDIANLGFAFPALEQVSGMLTADIAVTGPWNEPALSGPVSMTGGSVSLPLGGSVVGVSAIALHARFVGDALVVDELSGTLGDGQLVGSGEVAGLFAGNNRRAVLTFELDQATLEPVDGMSVVLGGDVKINQASQSAPIQVAGEIHLLNGVYEDNIDMIRILRTLTQVIVGRDSSGAASSPRGSAGGKSPVELDLRVLTDTPVLIETNIVQAEVSGDVRFLGSGRALKADGAIVVERGSLGSETAPIEIVSGKLSFSRQAQQMDPRLDITGIGTLQSQFGELDQVRMVIGGTLTKPTIHFYADSGMSENEIVSRLGLQLGAKNSLTLASRRRKGTLTEYARDTSGASVTDRLVALAGFTEVNIRPSLSPVTGEFTPAVVAKRPLTRDFDLTLEAELAGTQTSSASVEYPLTPYLSLFSRWVNRSVTDPNSTSGAVDTGIRLRKSFSGTQLLPRSLIPLLLTGRE